MCEGVVGIWVNPSGNQDTEMSPHAYTHTYTDTDSNTHTHSHMHTHTIRDNHIYADATIFVICDFLISKNNQTKQQTHRQRQPLTHTHTHTHTHSHSHTHTHTQTTTHTHNHTHAVICDFLISKNNPTNGYF